MHECSSIAIEEGLGWQALKALHCGNKPQKFK